MERSFKGIWIPKEIWLSKELTLQEKVFLVEISSLDNDSGCFANNQYFASFFGISKTRVSIVINSLVEKGHVMSLIKEENGNKRKLKTLTNKSLRPSQTKVKDPRKQKFKHNNTINNTINNIVHSEERTTSINLIWKSYPMKKNKKSALVSINKLLNKYSLDELLRAIKRYDDSVDEKKYLAHGSTFFNSTYFDWVDENYEETIESDRQCKKGTKTGSFKGYKQQLVAPESKLDYS